MSNFQFSDSHKELLISSSVKLSCFTRIRIGSVMNFVVILEDVLCGEGSRDDDDLPLLWEVSVDVVDPAS